MTETDISVDRRVWKFVIHDFSGVNDILTPLAAKVVLFDMQNGKFHVWFEVNPHSPTVERRLHVVGTGHTVPRFAIHRGSLQHEGFVWHLYEARLAAPE